MPTVTLTATSASPQTWVVPADAPVGTVLTVETWGAGSGGSGSSTSFRAGGAGGAWAKSLYTVTPNDVTNGISYSLQGGTAGTAAANSTVGPDTSFSTNNLNVLSNTIMNGAVVGTPGTLPTNWSYNGVPTGVTTSVVAVGIELNSGLPYIDLRWTGTPAAGATVTLFFQVNAATTASSTYTESMYVCYNPSIGTGNTHITSPFLQTLDGTSFATLAFANYTITTTLTRQSASATTSGTNTLTNAGAGFVTTTGQAIDFQFRIAGVQLEKAGAATFYKSTPGYTLAKGGGATSGTTGGVGGATGTSIGSVLTHAGGSGATRTQGGGGGGGSGAAGAGTSATTGTGGTGDAGSGGAAGVSNVEGGGGATASTTPTAAGDPSGGGGANTSTGSGSAGGRGQIRITYTGRSYGPMTKPWKQRAMLMR